MSAYSFRRDPLEQSDHPWRPLDRALLRWVRAHGGSGLLAEVAAWTSLADGNGDTALSLRDRIEGRFEVPWSDDEIASLRREALVGDGRADALTPFVLDDDDRFYLRRNYRDEELVAAAVRGRRAANHPGEVTDAELDALFHGRRDAEVEPQRRAVRQVVDHSLFVLTGGPGTGKTTTVLRMLLMLQRHASVPLRITLAAPTGKAAQRLSHALQHGKHDLLAAQDEHRHPQCPLPADWQDLLTTIPDGEVLTLHRLLGFQSRRNTFMHNARHTIAADVVVVDEASMIDLAMMRRLLDALRPDATLILAGDADQLTSIAAGSVLMDLVALMEAAAQGDLVRLRHSFRAERALIAINESVRQGDRAAFAAALAADREHAIRHAVANGGQLAIQLRRWTDALATLDGLRPRLPYIDDDAMDPLSTPFEANPGEVTARVLSALDALAKRQLLCALREGEFGAERINALIERRLKRAWMLPDDAVWYAGRAILITRNDYSSRLFNGDIGLCLANANGRLRVWFAEIDEAGKPGARSCVPSALPAHDSAFAITIHKSQGSEYERLAVLLPPDAGHRILSRQLLYTGLSRARRFVELWSTDAALESALARPVRRVGGMAERLRCSRIGED